MTTLSDQIKKTRDIKECSLNTYLSALKKIKNLVTGNKEITTNLDFLKDYDKVMKDAIDKEKKIASKKNKLTAILVALKSEKNKDEDLIKKYNDILKELGEEYIAQLKEQTKTDTQKKNWLDYRQVISILNKMLKEIKHLKIHKKDELSNKEFDLLQQYVVLLTYVENPIRNDFADMKILTQKQYDELQDEEKDKNNYLVIDGNKKVFHINDFKNKKRIGKKTYNISKRLSKMIDIFTKHNKSGYFLVQSNKTTPMNSNNITKYLNKIFIKYAGKKISSSMIRHIVISHLLKGKETIKEKEAREKEIEDKFMHSSTLNNLYRKVDKK